MSPLAATLAVTLGVTLAILFVLWLVATSRRDVSLVDIYWGLGFPVVAWIAVLRNGMAPRPMVMAILVTVWGVRLAAYLLWRKWGEDEDRRYTAMRDHHGPRFWWVSLFTVFLFQGVILWWVAFPFQVAAVHAGPKTIAWSDIGGAGLWLVGFLFEAISDTQMARFQSSPANKGQVMDCGLWRYTRHPNYFGEFLMAWGYYLLSLAAGGGWTVLSPLIMTGLLLKVSGVSLLESTITARRPGYADYQRRTNAFFPWPPRNTASQ